jgi:hypothetical protein
MNPNLNIVGYVTNGIDQKNGWEKIGEVRMTNYQEAKTIKMKIIGI